MIKKMIQKELIEILPEYLSLRAIKVDVESNFIANVIKEIPMRNDIETGLGFIFLFATTTWHRLSFFSVFEAWKINLYRFKMDWNCFRIPITCDANNNKKNWCSLHMCGNFIFDVTWLWIFFFAHFMRLKRGCYSEEKEHTIMHAHVTI